MSTSIVMGPVLSFRGLTPVSKKQALWKVSALIVVGTKEKPPALVFPSEGKSVPAPMFLASVSAGDVYRYDLSVTLGAAERRVVYGLDGEKGDMCWPAERKPGQRALCWSFTVPALGQAPRMAYFSCNGFSDPKLIKELKVPATAVWHDLLCNHDKALRPVGYELDREQQWHEQVSHSKGLQRFHMALGGGDQVYMDGVWTALQGLNEWVELDANEQVAFVPGKQFKQDIQDYYWEQYALRWSMVPGDKYQDQAAAYLNAGLAFASLPTVMMWDDHDIFDGWGSYSYEKQKCPLMQTMFEAARKAFWVMQLQMPLDLLPPLKPMPGMASKDPLFAPVDWTAVRAADVLAPAFLDGQPGFSHQLPLGDVALSVMDLRTERSQKQILSQASWSAWQNLWNGLAGQSHVLIMSSVPVAHPKLGVAEGVLDLTSSDSVTNGLADDLNDHWSHDSHEDERKRLVRTLVALGERMNTRVTLISGDVHVAAWGFAGRNVLASNGQRINQFTSTAIVHPGPTGLSGRLFLWYLNQASKRPQALDSEHTVSMMLFPATSDYVLAKRNWMALELDVEVRDEFGGKPRLWATWRTEQGEGEFSNHLVAVHPYKSASGGAPLLAAEGGLAMASRGKR